MNNTFAYVGGSLLTGMTYECNSMSLFHLYPWEGLRERSIETLAGFHAFNVWQVISKLPV